MHNFCNRRTRPIWNTCSIRRGRHSVQSKRGESGDGGEILVPGEQGRMVLNRNGRDQGVHGGHAETIRAGQPGNRGCFTIGGKAARLQHRKPGKVKVDAIYIARQPLQNLGYDDPGQRDRSALGDQPPQLATGIGG